ncbi:MAG: class I SAM-dependent methyltransferase [Candidatus Komeilibacteria bacterium]
MTPWEKFEVEKLTKIFEEKKDIIDIGGGLRIQPGQGNRCEQQRLWLKDKINSVNYKIVDKVADFHPDIVGDIHQLPLADNSVEAVICIAVLEHVEEPQKAAREIHRVLKPGGYAYIYLPFLYYYHPLPGYYGDFYRYTIEGARYLLREFSGFESVNVRGALETVNKLYPVKLSRLTRGLTRLLDRWLHKTSTNQTSGYNIFLTK